MIPLTLTTLIGSMVVPGPSALSPLSIAVAQDPSGVADVESGWSFGLKPYLWGAGLDGDVTIEDVTADVDAGFDDLLSHLDLGFMLGFEASPPDSNWTFLFDVVYVDLGDDNPNADVDVSLLIPELDVAYRPDGWENVQLLAGLRYWDVDLDLAVGMADRGRSEEWLDPVIGARGDVEFSDDWSMVWRGDVGGFGVGSDFSFQAFAAVQYELGANTNLALGWRHLDVDYEEDDFGYDTQTTGPVFGFGWTF